MVSGLVVVGGLLVVYLRSSGGSVPPPKASSTSSSTSTPGGGGATGATGPTGPTGPTGGTGVGPSGATGTTTTAGATTSFATIAAKLHSGENISFDAQYLADTSTGTQSVEYAASPPRSYLFRSSQPSGAVYELIGNSGGSYACRQLAHTTNWTCLLLPAPAGSAYKAFTQTYTGAYWYKQMESLAAAATVAGVQYTTSTMQVAGQTLDCISYNPKASSGGEVCVTSSGVLGYVHDVSAGTTYRLTHFSSTAAQSLFQTPAGAQVTGTT